MTKPAAIALLLFSAIVATGGRPFLCFGAGALPGIPAQGGGVALHSIPEHGGGGNDTSVFRLMFWNLENFFAPGEFEGHHWSSRRFYSKCNAVAKTMLLADEFYGGLPDAAAFAEVGNRTALNALVYATPLRKLDYSIVHYDSPDHRGIDCALLFRRSRFRQLSSKACHLYDGNGAVLATRDILLAVLEPLLHGGDNSPKSGENSPPDAIAVLVNHHPSKVGEGSQRLRQAAMERLRFLVDSLKATGIVQIIAVGDFNDEVPAAAGLRQGSSGVLPQSRRLRPYSVHGTIKFQGKWEKIDCCPVLEGLEGEEYIMALPQLSTEDSYGGVKPRRSFSGPRYVGGVSDHYPVFYLISRAPSLTTTS